MKIPNHEPESLSWLLHSSLPSREDIKSISEAYPLLLTHEFLTLPYSTLGQRGLKSAVDLLEAPAPDAHPVLIARYMLHLAIYLQLLPVGVHQTLNHLKESPQAMMKRLAQTAIQRVSRNDELLGSIEGLECVMLESLFEGNGGNLRRSWMAVRRAMLIAQLMGLHQSSGRTQYKLLEPGVEVHPHFMLFRIIFYDRHLCLLLGLPQGSLDYGVASATMLANDTPMGRLERMHCVLSARILERNQSEPNSHDFSLTQNIDMKLQDAARNLPSKWWLTPDLKSVEDDPQALFWEMRRFFNQLFHYNILNQLHVPYMLCSSAGPQYDYSRIMCVNASREMLSRFIMFRTFTQVASCGCIVELLALMASLTLLLVHLDSHRISQTYSLLAHQHLSDRAMMETALEHMERVSQQNTQDTLSAQSAELLRRLLAIEDDAADGKPHGAKNVSLEVEGVQSGGDEKNFVRVHIPYFGIIKIAREGVISKENTRLQPTAAEHSGFQSLSTTGSSAISPTSLYEQAMGLSDFGSFNTDSLARISAPLNSHYTETFPQMVVPFLEQFEYPVLTAGAEDWAFQGVDLAFFDSLMRGTENDGNGESMPKP
jgi:hypothetical protein